MSLSNDQIDKLLYNFNVEDQGGRKSNLKKLKEVVAMLPSRTKKESSATPGPETTTSQDVFPSSSSIPLRASSESKSFSTVPSVMSLFCRASPAPSRTSTTSTSTSPANSAKTAATATTAPNSPLSVTVGKNTRGENPSQPQGTGHTTDSILTHPGKKSLSSHDTVPAEAEKRVKPAFMRKLSEMVMRRDKGKGKEVDKFGGLSVVQEADLDEDLYGISPVSRTLLSASLGARTDPDIGPSHSKVTKTSTRDYGNRPGAGFAVAQPSSSSARQVVFAEPVINTQQSTSYTEGNSKGGIKEELRTDLERVEGRNDGKVGLNWIDVRRERRLEISDFYGSSSDDVDLFEWKVDRASFDMTDDDDIDMAFSEDLVRREELTEERLDFFRKAMSSVTEAYHRNLEMGISFEETGNRLYRGEVLVQE